MRHLPLLSLALAVAAALVSMPARAASPSLVPDDAAWVIQFNTTTLMSSEFGKALQDLASQEEPNAVRFLDGLSNTLGIDLFTGLGQGVLFGQSFEPGALRLAIDLGPTPGNIEGLLMAAPGYQSTVYRNDILIHSVLNEKGAHTPATERNYIAIVSAADHHTLLAAHDQKTVETLIDQLRMEMRALVAEPLTGSQFLKATITRPPPGVVKADVRQLNIIAVLEEINVQGKADTRMTLNAQVEAIDALRAKQVAQLIQGGVAALQIAAIDRPRVEHFANFFQNLTVTHIEGETRVDVSISFTPQELITLRPNRLDL